MACLHYVARSVIQPYDPLPHITLVSLNGGTLMNHYIALVTLNGGTAMSHYGSTVQDDQCDVWKRIINNNAPAWQHPMETLAPEGSVCMLPLGSGASHHAICMVHSGALHKTDTNRQRVGLRYTSSIHS